MRCPDCATALTSREKVGRHFFFCPDCDGQAVTLPVLKAEVDQGYVKQLWAFARPASCTKTRACPSCATTMQAIHPPAAAGSGASALDDLTIELCRACQLLWFDAGELQRLPGGGRVSDAIEPDPDARMALAHAKLLSIAAEASLRDTKLRRAGRIAATGHGVGNFGSSGSSSWDPLRGIISLLSSLFD